MRHNKQVSLPLFMIWVLGVTSMPLLAEEKVIEAPKLEVKQVKRDIINPAMTGDVIAEHYADWTGKRVLISNAAASKSIFLNLRAPISYPEAANFIEKACILEGLVFVPSGENTVKLVLAADVKPQGVKLIQVESLIPKGDVVVSYLMKFEHIPAEDARTAFQSISGSLKPHASITVVENINSLILTEKASVIKSLLGVKKAIDLPQSQVNSAMIALKNADSEVLADQLKAIIEVQVEEKTRVARSDRAPENTAPAGTTPAVTETATSGQLKKLSLVADARTNSIFVMGRPVDILFVKNLVSLFDQPAENRNFYSYKLKYLPVGEFLPVAQTGIQRTLGETSGSASPSTPQNPNTSTTSGGERGTSLADTERPEQPQSLLVGKTLLVADNTNNTLIVQGPPQSIDIVKSLITQMDIAAQQVQITAVFGRYTMDGEKSLGFDFSRTFKRVGNDSGFAVQSNTGFPILTNPANITAADLFPVATDGIGGLSIYGQVGRSFFTYLRALESDGKFKLLSRPTLFTTNNRKALLSSGQRIAVPTSTLSQSVAGAGSAVSQNTNIEFRDVLLKLEVIPLVNSKDEVTLKISFLNDNVVGNQTINGNSIPTIGTEELYTTVKVPNNGTIALGGLITERTRNSKTGVPILSSIPGIGQLFSSNTDVTTKEELVILIQPRIVNGATQLNNLQKYNKEQSKIYREFSNKELPVTEADDPRMYRQEGRATKQNPQYHKTGKQGASPRDRFKGHRR